MLSQNFRLIGVADEVVHGDYLEEVAIIVHHTFLSWSTAWSRCLPATFFVSFGSNAFFLQKYSLNGDNLRKTDRKNDEILWAWHTVCWLMAEAWGTPLCQSHSPHLTVWECLSSHCPIVSRSTKVTRQMKHDFTKLLKLTLLQKMAQVNSHFGK